MVSYDNKRWITKLIRTAFTLEDDTGISEKVLKERVYVPRLEGESSPSSASSNESFDIRDTSSDIGHRRRSNTAVRLEKLDKQKRAQVDTQKVLVDQAVVGKSEFTFERDVSFKDRDKKGEGSKLKACPDGFSLKNLIESVPDPNDIPFAQYSRYEASSQPEAANKQLCVFLTFLEESQRAYPMRVIIVASSKVIDLIGLTLWLTSRYYPKVKPATIHHYSLQIADEDGAWDREFPPLERGEPVSKFSFPHLALVKLDTPLPDAPFINKTQYTFLLPSSQTFRLGLDDLEITLGQLINIVLEKSGWTKRSLFAETLSMSYHFEKLGDPRTEFTDLSVIISQIKTREFCLVRDGAKSVQASAALSKELASGTINPADMVVGRSYVYQVQVSTGRFNKLRNALCVIWSGDRMDLEFQHKTKSYALSSLSGVKYDALKNKIMVSITTAPSVPVIGSHYLTSTSQVTFITSEQRIAKELYQHLNTILLSK